MCQIKPKEIASTKGEIKQQDILYYMSSLAPDVERVGKEIRSHWGVESVHWFFDVTFKEDDI